MRFDWQNSVTLVIVCVFCINCLKYMNHPMFEYPFAKRIWDSVMNFYLVLDLEFEWDELVAWELAQVKGKSLIVSIFKFIYGCKGMPLCMLV